MSLKDQISEELKTAMKARDQFLVETLRSAISALGYKKAEKDKDTDLTAEEELAVIQKQVKQRNDAIAEYTKAGRTELADKEVKERDILQRIFARSKVRSGSASNGPGYNRCLAGRLAQSRGRDEGRHAPAQGSGRWQPCPSNCRRFA